MLPALPCPSRSPRGTRYTRDTVCAPLKGIFFKESKLHCKGIFFKIITLRVSFSR